MCTVLRRWRRCTRPPTPGNGKPIAARVHQGRETQAARRRAGMRKKSKKRLYVIAGVLIAMGAIGAAAAGTLYYAYPVQVSTFAGLARNYFLTWLAPPGTTTTEVNAAYQGLATVGLATSEPALRSVTIGDWPSYNRTLSSERHSPLSEINTNNVGKLKVLCTYDIG